MEACEEKRIEYKKKIEDIPIDKIVYIDESGIEMKIIKDRGWGTKKESFQARKVENIMNGQISSLGM